jgi:hypothetical protein
MSPEGRSEQKPAMQNPQYQQMKKPEMPVGAR